MRTEELFDSILLKRPKVEVRSLSSLYDSLRSYIPGCTSLTSSIFSTCELYAVMWKMTCSAALTPPLVEPPDAVEPPALWEWAPPGAPPAGADAVPLELCA